MPIKDYGLWKGTLKRWDVHDARTDRNTPHGHIMFVDDSIPSRSNKELECSVNVKSSDRITEVVYWKFRAPNFFDPNHPIIGKLKGLTESRFYPKDENPELTIDYIRDGLFNLEDGHIPPWNTPGQPNDDMVDFLADFVENGVANKAKIYIFGQKYDDDDGIHQVHQVQGSFFNSRRPKWFDENGTHQDGGIFFEFPDGTWEAFFIAFASQAWKTDEKGNPTSGNMLDFLAEHGGIVNPPPSITPPPGGGSTHPTPALPIRIHSALINPKGPDNDPILEMIRVENNGETDAKLAGWSFENQDGKRQKLPADAFIAARGQGEFRAGDCYLTNTRDGKVLLKDDNGRVVDIVEYKRADAAQQGKWIAFHEGDA